MRQGRDTEGSCEAMDVAKGETIFPESLRPPHSVKKAEASGSGHHRFAGGGYGRASGDTEQTSLAGFGSRSLKKYFFIGKARAGVENSEVYAFRRDAPS